MPHSVSPSVRNRRFHIEDEIFGFERFISAIYGFVSPIITEESLRITSMFIYREEKTGRPYGQYRLPASLHSRAGFADEARFLSAHKLYLDQGTLDENGKEQFSVKRIYDAYYAETPDKDNIFSELKGNNLSEYFRKLPEDAVTDSGKIDFDQAPHNAHTPENFLQAELVMVHTLLEQLNTQTGYYWPLPIIAFGDLIGMLYFVYDQEKLNKQVQAGDLATYTRLFILNVTREYEKIVLDSKLGRFADKPEDSLGDYQEIFFNLDIGNYRFMHPIRTPRPLITKNFFLLDLGYDVYYRRFADVYIEETKAVRILNRTRIRSAIISIIVDSFAHNVGAHSLVAMKWWEENRFKILDREIPLEENGEPVSLVLAHEIPAADLARYAEKDPFYEEMSRSESAQSQDRVSLIDIFRKMDAKRQNELFQFKSKKTNKVFAQAIIPLNSTYHYYEFLRNKSAFWSGVTRDTVFSGRLRNWFHLLRDFLRNSLFLGTIAHSEGINRIHFYVEIVRHDGVIQHTGKYVEINLDVIRHERFDEDYQAPPRQIEELSDYAFLRPGEQYEPISAVLKQLDPLYLPSEMIGQQAFYNLIENTLRNIKHYNKRLDHIRKDGIRLYFSIQEVGLVERKGEGAPTPDRKLYKVGTWLHHEQDLIEPYYDPINRENREISVIDRHTRQLKQRIMDRHGRVRLGGSSQDKVCAAMLLNNTFYSIEDKTNPQIKRHYYPYVFPASEPFEEQRKVGQAIQDEILHILYNPRIRAETSEERAKNYEQEAIAYRDRLRQGGDKGVIKKYFHLWKGEDCKLVEADFKVENENLTRFRIVAVDRYRTEEKELDFVHAFAELRKQGIVRIIPASRRLKVLNAEDRYKQAMAKWLTSWLQGRQNEEGKTGLRLLKQSGGQWKTIGLMELVQIKGQWQVTYDNETGIENRTLDPGDPLVEDTLKAFPELKLVHGTGDTKNTGVSCRIRSHCSMMNYVYDPDCKFGELNSVDRTRVKAAKLLETVLTRIVVFDNRMYSRLPGTQYRDLDPGDNAIRDQIGLQIYPERAGRFMNNRVHFLKDCQVLVLHLSFLEWIWKDEQTKVPYREGEVKAFFDKEIKTFYEETFGKPFPENFLLVVTSGRGRGDWASESLQDPQITFRPIEALVDAVEDGLTMKDDYQIKHNLCNLIFGS